MPKALARWLDGDPDAACAIWDQILDEHPHDILAFRLAHFLNFWSGRPEAMLASVLSVERHWSDTLPGYGSILACRCFAHEEPDIIWKLNMPAAKRCAATPPTSGPPTVSLTCWK